MESVRSLDEFVPSENTVLTVGTFDGVHIGHQEILARLIDRARKIQGKTLVVTFDPHPRQVINQREEPRPHLITTPEEKLDILSSMGIDQTLILRFTREFSEISSEAFARHILYKRLGAKGIVLGYDHAFGRDREGTLETLRNLQKELGFFLDIVPAYVVGDVTVSSTKIRKAIQDGEVVIASELLGRNHFLNGIVVKGEGRGKQLGFPTANVLSLSPEKLIPKDGVYAVLAQVRQKLRQGVLNVGSRPTFPGSPRAIEVHLFEFDEDVYGEPLRIEFLDHIRDERKFSSIDSLRMQIDLDCRRAREILNR